MTMWAAARGSNTVVIHVCSGSVQVEITEFPGHVRAFWSSLGRALDEVEHPKETDDG